MGFFSRSKDAERAPEEDSSNSTRQLLGKASLHKAPAIVACCNQGSTCQAHFVAAMPDAVVLELIHDVDCPFLPPATLCSVSFGLDAKAHVFLAQILEHTPADKARRQPERLRLQMPEQIASAEGRLMFRAPIPPDCPLEAAALVGSAVLPVRAINVSLSGAFVEGPATLDVPVGGTFKLRLKLGDDAIDLDAEVRRRQGTAYGLFFPETMHRAGPEAPDALRAIYRDLEARWLRARRGSLDE